MFDFVNRLQLIVPDALDRVRRGVRAEAQAAGARLVGVWDFYRGCLRVLPQADLAVVDTYDEIAAEIGASVGRTSRYGHAQLNYAIAMHERIPKVGAALLAGDIDYSTFATIVYRTALVKDPDLLATIDERIASVAAGWTASARKLGLRVDGIVATHDPDAVRTAAEEKLDDCGIEVSPNQQGFAEIHGQVLASTGAAFDARLTALAHTVCSADPRSVDRRRADALDAVVAGLDRLRCRCGRSDCPARAKDKKAGPTTVYLVGERAPDVGTPPDEPDTESRWRPGYLMGSDELIPPEVMEEIVASATIVPIRHPGPHSAPECGYRPSKKLCDYIRARDLTCRAPGCDKPATHCEIDHTIPRDQGGPTHPSNLKLLCEFHHILKTFWGWQDEQLPDGTVIWRLPSGQVYTTEPGSRQLFPDLCAPTGALDLPRATPRCEPNHLKMPKRNTTRRHERAGRVDHERAGNRERRKIHEQRLARDADENPPPF